MVGKRGNKPSTARTYLNNIRLFQRKYRNLDQVCHDDIVNHLADMKIKQNKNANTRRLRKTSLETFFEWYSEYAGIINPAIGLDPIKKYVAFPKLIHPEEVERMCYFASMDDGDRGIRNPAIIAFLADVGCRIEELEKIKTGDIRIVHDHFECTIPALKGTISRIVPFSRLIEGTLSEYFSRYYLWLITEKKQIPTKPLFFKLDYKKLIQEDMTAPLLRGGINYIIKKTAYKAGIDRKISAHQFRHFYATYSIINKMDIFTLRDYLGHANISTTQGYIHIADTLSGEALKHSPTRTIKSIRNLSGYVNIVREINKQINR